jgi:hypothetical protein
MLIDTSRFGSYEALEKMIEKQILPDVLSVMKNIGKDLLKQMRDFIAQNWYGSYSPKYYDRTFQLLNSLNVSEVVATGQGYEIVVDYDRELIHPATSITPENWNIHESVDGVEDVSQWIPNIIEFGSHSPLYSMTGIHPTEETLRLYDVINEFTSQLAKKGYTITFKKY